MRRGYSNSGLIEENGTFFGISLGSDFCAEHEWGTKELQEILGIDSKKMGIDGRTISRKNSPVVFVIEGDQAILRTKNKYGKNEENPTLESLSNRDLTLYGEETISTAWDGSSFGILVKGKENIEKLKELYSSFENNNIALAYMGGNSPFKNASLSLLIKDRLPKESVEQMYAVDKKAKDLVDYEKKIGITALKEKAKSEAGYKGIHYFMACSPRWINYEDEKAREEYKKKSNTKYDISYWVNYSDDDDNYGHYTAEEIIQWLSTPGLKLAQIRKAK